MFFTTLRTALPFPIRKLQVDNGTEFPLAFALTVQQAGDAAALHQAAVS
jgi:hypothetical protein